MQEYRAYRYIKYYLTVALATIFLLFSSCGPSNEASSPTATESESPTTSATVTPESTPVPTITHEPSPSPTYSFVGQAVCSAIESANIREKAGTDGQVIGTLPSLKTVGVIEFKDNWAFIQYGNLTGYVNRDYLLDIYTPDVKIPTGEWANILVNPSHYLPEGFSVSVADFKNGQVDKRILAVCEQMFEDAKKDGIELKLVDAYRSFELQKQLYEQKVDSYIAKGYTREEAEKEAATITARPGTSEHQTGLALDIVTPSYTKRDSGFADTKAFKWLDANAYNYGFTLRYKKGKESITKIIFEPWHWRFVGVKAAIEMKITGECLEEYFGAAD